MYILAVMDVRQLLTMGHEAYVLWSVDESCINRRHHFVTHECGFAGHFSNTISYKHLSLNSLLWRPTQLYLRGEEEKGRRGEPKTVIPVYSWHTLSKRAQNIQIYTVDIHFQNAHKTQKLRRLALCAFVYRFFLIRHKVNMENKNK